MADKNDEDNLSQAVGQAIIGVTGTEAAEGVGVLQNALSSLNATDTAPLSVIASNLSYIKDTAKNASEEIEKLDTKLENFANVNDLISYINKKYANGMANLITAEDRRASGYVKVAIEEKKARIKEKETPEYKERQQLENEKIKQQIAERKSSSYKKATVAKNEITIRKNETQKNLEINDPDFFVNKELQKAENQKLRNQEIEDKIVNGYFTKMANKAEAQADWLKSPEHLVEIQSQIKSRNNWSEQASIANVVKKLLGADFLAKERQTKEESLSLRNQEKGEQLNANYVQIKAEQMTVATELSQQRAVATENRNRIAAALGDDFAIKNEQIKQNRDYYKVYKDKIDFENGIPVLQVGKTKRQEETSRRLIAADKDFFIKSEQLKQYAAELNNSIENLKYLNGYYEEQAKSIKKHNEVLGLLSASFLKANEEEKQTSLALKNRREQILLDSGAYEERIKAAKLNNEVNNTLGADFLADKERIHAETLKNNNLKNEYWMNNGGLDADIKAKELANQLKSTNGYIETQVELQQERKESLKKQNELNEALGNEALMSERLAEIANKQAKARINNLKAEENETEEHKGATKARNKNTIDNRNFDELIEQLFPGLRQKARQAGYEKKITRAEAAEIRLENLKSKVYGEGFGESVRKALAGVEQRLTGRSGFVGVASRFTENMFKNKLVMGREVDSSGKVIKAGTQLGGLVGGGIALILEKIYKWAVQYGKEAMQAFGKIESIKTNLNVVYGSQSLASQSFNDIANYAIKSPFGIQQMTEFAILLKQSGVESVDLMTTLKQIGDVAGGNQEKFQRIANNYAQIIAANRATALDLRQFANAGLPIYQEIRKELGVSQKEVRDMTRDGLVGAETIQKVFKNMTSKGGTFYNAVNQGAKTYKARMQNMSDTKLLNFSEIGEWLYNVNPTQSTEGSTFKAVLALLEGVYVSIGGLATEANQNREIRHAQKYSKKYETLLNNINDKTSEELIPKIESVYSPDEARQKLANKYDLAKSKLEYETSNFKSIQDFVKKIEDSNTSSGDKEFYKNLLKDFYNFDYSKTRKGVGPALVHGLMTKDFSGLVFYLRRKKIKEIYDVYGNNQRGGYASLAKAARAANKDGVLNNKKAQQASDIVKGERLVSDSFSNVVNNAKQKDSMSSLIDKYSELYKKTEYYKEGEVDRNLKEIEKIEAAKKVEQKYGIETVKYNNSLDILNSNSASFDWIKKIYKSNDVEGDFNKLSAIIRNQYSASDIPLELMPENLKKDKQNLERTFSVLKENVNLFTNIFDSIGDNVDNIEGGKDALEIFSAYKEKISNNIYANPELLPVEALKNFSADIGKTKQQIDKLSDDNPFKELFPLLFTELVHDSLKDIDTDKLLKDTLPQWERILQKTLSIPEDVFKKGKVSTFSALGFSNAMNEKTVATNFTQQMLASGLKVSDITKLMPLYHTTDYIPNINEKYFGSDQKTSRFFGVPDFSHLVRNADEADSTKQIPLNSLFGTNVTRFSKELGFENGNTIYEFDKSLNESIKSLSNFSDKLRDIRSFNSSDAAKLYKDIALGYSATGNENFDNKLNSGSLASQYATDLSNFTTTLSTLLSQGMFQSEDASLLYDKESMKKLGLQDGDIESFKKKFVALGFTFDEQKQSFKNVTADVVQSLLDLSSNLSVTATTVATFKKEIDTNKSGKDKQDFLLDANKRYASLRKRYGINEDTFEEGLGTAYDSFAEQARQEGYDKTSAFMREALDAISSGDASSLLSRSKEISNEVDKENYRRIADVNDSIEEYISKNQAVSDWLIENGGSITIDNVSDFISQFSKQFPELENYSTIDTDSLTLSDSDKKAVLSGILDEFIKSLYDKKSTDASKGKETLPFYKRLSGSVFNIPDSVLKNLNGTKGIFDYRNAANTRLSNEAIAKALVKETGNINSFKTQIIREENTFTGIGENRTQAVNQEQTFNRLESLALSLKTNSSVTNAYAEQLQNQKEQLENLMSAAAFRMEDADKVTTKELAEQMGYTPNDIKALESTINAFSLTGNETLSTLLDRTYEYTKVLATTTSALGSFKAMLEESTKNTEKTKFETNNIFSKTDIPAEIYNSKMEGIYNMVDSTGIAKLAGKSNTQFIREALTTKSDVNAPEHYDSFLKEQIRLGGLLKDGKGDLSKEKDWDKYYKKTGEENGQFTYEKINLNADYIMALIREIIEAAKNEANVSKTKEEVQSLKDFTGRWAGRAGDKNLETKPENLSDANSSIWEKAAGAFDFMNLRSYTDYEGNAMSKYGKNSREQQIAMNWLAENGEAEASKKDIREWASGRVNNLNSLEGASRENAIEDAKNSFLEIGQENGIDDYQNKVESVFEKIRNGSADAGEALADLGEKFGLAGAKTDSMDKKFSSLAGNIKSTAKAQFLGAINDSFTQISKNIAAGEDASDGLYKIWKNMASTVLGTIGATMTSTGLEIAAEGARTNNKADIVKGLALAAAGGVANIAGGMLSDSSSSDSDNDRAEEQRIQNLKDALADLIDQAKTDAEYYQKNLMHKNALATNESISTRSYDVNDAIITPNGNVVSTHPDDYLIATKTPEQFLNGGSSGVNLQVNSIINNNSSNVTATTETVENADGSIDIITTICDVVNSGLAEGKFDDGLAAYDYRQQGRSVAS